ncbi:hypothetical protein V1477_020276, partial [Vespula maculifrons]
KKKKKKKEEKKEKKKRKKEKKKYVNHNTRDRRANRNGRSVVGGRHSCSRLRSHCREVQTGQRGGEKGGGVNAIKIASEAVPDARNVRVTKALCLSSSRYIRNVIFFHAFSFVRRLVSTSTTPAVTKTRSFVHLALDGLIIADVVNVATKRAPIKFKLHFFSCFFSDYLDIVIVPEDFVSKDERLERVRRSDFRSYFARFVSNYRSID